VHGSDFHYVLLFFGFQDAVAPAARHAGYVEEFGAVYHVVICEKGVRLRLEGG